MFDAELKERLLELKLQPLIDFLDSVENFDGKASDLQGEVDDVKSELASHSGDIYDLDSEMDGLKRRIEELECDNSNAKKLSAIKEVLEDKG